MLDWSLKFRFFDLSKITVFVLDEADVMIATQVGLLLIQKRQPLLNLQGHQDQSIRIHKNLGPYCQMLLFSATYDQVVVAFNSCTLYLDGKPSENPTVQAVMDFAENIVSNPVTIKLRREEESLDNIKQVLLNPQSALPFFFFHRPRGELESFKLKHPQVWVDCPTPEAKYRSIANIYGVITIGQVSNC